jgi:ATP-binding cassette subfamily B protein
MVQIENRVSAGLIIRFMRWMFRVAPSRAAWSFVLQVAMSLASAVHLWIFSQVVNQAIAVYDGTGQYTSLLQWISAWAIFTIVSVTLFPLFTITDERMRQELEDELLQQLQTKTNRLSLEVMERNDIHDLLNRAKSATEPGVMLNLIWGLFDIFRTLATVVSVSIVVAIWSPWLLLAIVLVTLPASLSKWSDILLKYKLGKKQIPDQRLMNYLAGLLTSRGAAKEIRIFQMSDWLLQWWKRLYWKVSDEQYKQERSHATRHAIHSIFGFIGLAGGIGWCAWSVVHGQLSTGQFAGMLVALQAVHQQMGRLFNQSGYTFEVLLKIGDFFTYLDLGPEEERSNDICVERIGKLQAERVTFQYPQAERPAVKEVSFTIQQGERIALVGENGSGKTTLVKLLMGLYTPTGGTIRFGEHDLRTLDIDQARGAMAAVFQDFNRYAVTMRDNIGFGDYEQKHNEHAVAAAAVKGGAADFIADMADGYHTLLTKQFTGGVDLSGGQWQKVAISRSFMRDAEVVALDEPTAALDPQAEADVFRRFMEMAEGKTALLVSHRLGLARYCDRILVMQGGTLVEEGTHEELMSSSGEYARMWEMQAGWYV